jgi:hypothetical protein
MAKLHSTVIQNRDQLVIAFKLISALPFGYVLEARDRTRTDDQNRLLWPMLGCFEKQANIQGRTFKDAQWKSIFMEALGHEQEILPSLDGSRWFPAGLRTSKLGVKEFSDLIELMNAEAAERGVELGEKETHNA